MPSCPSREPDVRQPPGLKSMAGAAGRRPGAVCTSQPGAPSLSGGRFFPPRHLLDGASYHAALAPQALLPEDS